jgi:hypothetical protein
MCRAGDDFVMGADADDFEFGRRESRRQLRDRAAALCERLTVCGFFVEPSTS